MRSVRQLPPLLRVLGMLGVLAPVASCGVNTWAFVLGWNSGEPPQPLTWALIDLGFACIWPVVVYNARLAPFRRLRHTMPWLDTWRGQLASALVLSALPMAAVIVALLVAPSTPLFWLTYMFDILFLLVFIATLAWAIV
jgi:hypothetical protein